MVATPMKLVGFAALAATAYGSPLEANPLTLVEDVVTMTHDHPAFGGPPRVKVQAVVIDASEEDRAASIEITNSSAVEIVTAGMRSRSLESASTDMQKLENYFGSKLVVNYNTLQSKYAKGEPSECPWPSSYWPVFQDSINVKWTNEPSPAEKYAKAFGKDVKQFMNKVSQENGIDGFSGNKKCSADADCSSLNDGSKCAIRDGAKSGYCIPTWYGICHAWAPASNWEPEPKCDVVKNNVTFHAFDLKGLISAVYDGAAITTVFTGSRFYGPDSATKLDKYGRYDDVTRRDLGAGYFHLAITNVMGVQKHSFVVDVTAGAEVWNQPVRSYEVIESKIMSREEAGKQYFGTDSYPFNTAAKSLAYTKTRFSWIIESYEDGAIVGTSKMDHYTTTADYEYFVELDGSGNVIGGEWLGNSRYEHPDFLWFATGTPNKNTVTDIGLSYKEVRDLIDASVACKGQPTPAPTTATPATTAPASKDTKAPVTTAPAGKETTAPPSGKTTTAPPSGKTTTAPPSGKETTAPPAGKTTTAPPSGKETTAPPAGKTTPAPPAGKTTPAPTTDSPISGSTTTPAPPAGKTTTAPPSGKETTAPPAGKTTTAPPSGKETTAPPAGKTTPAPTTDSPISESTKTPAPPAGKTTPAPPAGKVTPCPTTVSPPAGKTTPAPPAGKTTPAPTTDSPISGSTTTPAPPAGKVTPAPPAGKTTPAPPAGKVTPCPTTVSPPAGKETVVPPPGKVSPPGGDDEETTPAPTTVAPASGKVVPPVTPATTPAATKPTDDDSDDDETTPAPTTVAPASGKGVPPTPATPVTPASGKDVPVTPATPVTPASGKNVPATPASTPAATTPSDDDSEDDETTPAPTTVAPASGKDVPSSPATPVTPASGKNVPATPASTPAATTPATDDSEDDETTPAPTTVAPVAPVTPASGKGVPPTVTPAATTPSSDDSSNDDEVPVPPSAADKPTTTTPTITSDDSEDVDPSAPVPAPTPAATSVKNSKHKLCH